MHHFHYVGKELYCEEVPLKRIAAEVGTPCYVYSYATLTRHFEVFDGAFSSVPHLTCFAVKANSNIGVLNLLGRLGAGMDIVSGGELFRVRRAGIPAKRVVYSGVGKTVEEIDYALREGILMFNIESAEELELINSRAGALGLKAPVAIRVNPDVDPQTHPYISTGLKKNKFGIDVDLALKEYERASKLENVEIVGVDCHIGSQLTELAPFVDALRRLKVLISRLEERNIHIKYLDLGGGLGIPYQSETPPHPREYAEALINELRNTPYTLILEPGRVIVGNAGVLLTRVLYTKQTPSKKFLIVDAAMNDLIRPSLYGSYHAIRPVIKNDEAGEEVVDVVGPICESGDFLARERAIQKSTSGDLLAVMSAGAYGFTMASNYNSRPRPAEIMVKGSSFEVIRERESWEDLVRLERIPSF
ncbi:diaminopimelate decarboxylase [Thermodesulforhabdus norvegica]|uniref:Diaminopimelate decarboxylase n=1 Tax=Thermodesulforhabdus norvegica TaxID=39841 RepID=A0A1I4W4Z0_9BACT|nr:diaminopimelate decarboxylase [Thermodesulforhabdus norvegica]SFN08621.1 diaminopimelate decarboxylase [Thermodesulforhabdus norvegica]